MLHHGHMPVAAPVAVVLAVKRLDAAKSRLTPVVGTGPHRRATVAAMLADTLAAIADAGSMHVTVVSPDPYVQRVAGEAGAAVLDEPTPSAELTPLNAALAHGIADGAARARIVVAVQADLAALDAATVREAVDAAVEVIEAGARAAFVADRTGTGTALLAVVGPDPMTPRFGPASAAAHRAAGAVELDPEHRRWPRLRTDVDTPDDLAAALALGVGPRTRAALAGARDTGAAEGGRRQDSPAPIVHN